MSEKLAIIRVRGRVKMKKQYISTFKYLRLNKEHHCVILNNIPETLGMVMKVKDYTTFGKISDEVIESLVKKRGRKSGNKRLSTDEEKELIKQVKNNKVDNKIFKPIFRLKPPKKGFKSKKKPFPKGSLGFRKDGVNELLMRMI